MTPPPTDWGLQYVSVFNDTFTVLKLWNEKTTNTNVGGETKLFEKGSKIIVAPCDAY